MFSKLASPRWPLVAAAMLALVLAYPAPAAAAHFGGGHFGGFSGARFGGFHGGAYRGFGYGGFGRGYYGGIGRGYYGGLGRGYYGGFGRGYYGGLGRGYYGYSPSWYGGYGYGYYPNYLNVYPPYSYYPSTSLYLNATPPAVVADPYVAVEPAYSNGSALTATHADNTALITVDVPPNAQIMFNGTKTTSTGPERQFESPPLTPGKHFNYEVRAQWTNEDGRPVTQTRTVDVTAGANIHLTFPQAQASTTGQAETSEPPEGK